MHTNIIKFVRRIMWLLLLSLPCLSMAQPQATPAWALRYPEETIRGIRYFKYTTLINEVHNTPSLPYLWMFGFTLNTEKEGTYIAPDGKIIPAFYGGLWVMPPNERNVDIVPPANTPSTYSGEIYLPDFIEGFRYYGDVYVLMFAPIAMGEELTAIRTPLYSPIINGHFKFAANLQKAQIGASYVVINDSFNGCGKLETVIFEQAPYVYHDAFAACDGIKTVVLQSDKELPMLESAAVFPDDVYTGATLYLPDSLMAACDADPVWSKFTHRKSLKECTVEFMKQ